MRKQAGKKEAQSDWLADKKKKKKKKFNKHSKPKKPKKYFFNYDKTQENKSHTSK